jgi:hypothetical protein
MLRSTAAGFSMTSTNCEQSKCPAHFENHARLGFHVMWILRRLHQGGDFDFVLSYIAGQASDPRQGRDDIQLGHRRTRPTQKANHRHTASGYHNLTSLSIRMGAVGSHGDEELQEDFLVHLIRI